MIDGWERALVLAPHTDDGSGGGSPEPPESAGAGSAGAGAGDEPS